MKKILLPTDFSDNSWNAIEYAIHLYKDEECTFYLFNAYTPVIYHFEYVLINAAKFGLGDAIRETAQENLNKVHKKIIKQFGDNTNHKFDKIARFDTLVSGIDELIIEHKIDLIAMGTKGATGAKEILFGSNTVQVLKKMKCPILVIPSNFGYEPPHEVLFPTDLEVSYNYTHLNILINLAVRHNARVNAMHVSTGYELTEEQENNKLQLESLFNGTAFLYHDVKTMEIEEAINEFQVKHKINLLTMINNKHSFFKNLFFKNTINKIGFKLNIPFLVIPTKQTS